MRKYVERNSSEAKDLGNELDQNERLKQRTRIC